MANVAEPIGVPVVKASARSEPAGLFGQTR